MKLLILLLPFSLFANDACRNLVTLAQNNRGQLINFYKEDPSLYEQKDFIDAQHDKGSYVNALQGSVMKSDSQLFTMCQKTSSSNWDKIQGKVSQENWKLSWAIKTESVIATIQESYNACMKSGDTTALEADLMKAREIVTKHFKLIRKCEALRYLTSFSDYDDVEVNTKKKKMNSDGTITCQKSSALTQDWKGCIALIDTFDASQVALQAITVGHKIHFAFKTYNLSEDNYKNTINTQIKALQTQKEHSSLLMATYTAQAAALGVAIANMPKIDTILTHCDENFKGAPSDREYQKVMNSISSSFKLDYQGSLVDQSKQAICKKTVQHGNLGLLQNDMAKESAKGAALKIGLKAGEQVAITFIVEKNIKKLESMLRGVDEFKPQDLDYSLADLVVQECEVNPGSENCTNGQTYLQAQGFQGASVNVAGSGSSYSQANDLPNSDITFGSQNEVTSSGNGDKIAPIAGSKYHSSNINAPNRAAVKTNLANLGGGSGSANAGRIAAPSAGSKSGSGNQNKRYQSKSYAYKGKTARGYRGGNSKRSKKKSGGLFNKFTNLFKSKSEVTHFESRAAIEKASGRRLFEIISNRYHMIEKSKRLMEYTGE